MKTTFLQHQRIVTVASALFLLVCQRAAGALAVTDTANYNGHLYLLLENSNWTDAESRAVQLGGHLVTVNTQAENDWLYNQWANGRNLWIGFSDAAVEGTFTWASGEAVTFTGWNGGEPNNGGLPGADEDYTYMYGVGWASPGVWNDYQNLATAAPQPPLYGVVEIVPEPSSVCLLGLALLFPVIRSRSRGRKVGCLREFPTGR